MNTVANSKSGQQEELINQAARSFKWSILYNAAPRLITPFSTMILAALLTPADFGLVALSTSVMALAAILVDLGLGKAVVQNRTKVEEFASISMWLSLIMSFGIYLIIWIATPLISELYHNVQVINIIRVSAISLPLSALTTVPKGLLRREMKFNRLFWVNSSFLITQAIASVIFAWLGAGAWAIIWGQLLGILVSSVFVWAAIKWRPSFVWNWPIVKEQLRFSLWIMLSSLQNWLLLYADNIIAGIFLGIYSLGVYSLGLHIAILFPVFVVAALNDVAYPAFCKLQGNARAVGKSLIGLQRLTGALLFPIAFGISSIASPVIELLYGNKWEGLGTVISLLVIMPGLSSIWTLNESSYLSVGKPAIYTKLSAMSIILLLPLLWTAAPYGLITFTVARFTGALLLPLGNVVFGARSLELKISDQIKPLFLPFLAGCLMFVVVCLATAQLQPFSGLLGWTKLLLLIALGTIVYATIIRLVSKDLWEDLFTGVKRVFLHR
ncbi:MAG TPA: lipopolysaccharide biosynthesis protein [Anaerolineales bacterium]|nr:lipopolysaccharide biosynthesis protein [Anaerolineales bacterium]